MNGTAIPWRIFFYRIPLGRRMKNRIPQGWMIPQYRTLKSKLPKYTAWKKAQYRNTVSWAPCRPQLERSGSKCGILATWKQLYIILSLIERFHSRGPASMLIYWNKRKFLRKKRVQLPQDWFGTPTWRLFHCFVTPIWPPWRHVKTLYLQKIPGFNRGAITTS